jgi:hypothetical protein
MSFQQGLILLYVTANLVLPKVPSSVTLDLRNSLF